MIKKKLIISGHDVGSGGLITTLMEMCFSTNNIGAKIDLTSLNEKDSVKVLFSENSGIVIQCKDKKSEKEIMDSGIRAYRIGEVNNSNNLVIKNHDNDFLFDLDKFRDYWFSTSTLLDKKQTSNNLADVRFKNYKKT